VAGSAGTVSNVTALGFGVPAPGVNMPAMYMAGQVSGVSGIFRSLDGGVSWSRIDDATHQWGNVPVIAGDQQVFGRVYIGTNGRGILYGEDPQACFTCRYNNKAYPVITWNQPAPVSAGTALSGTQLNAPAGFGGNPLPGTYIYTPSIGTVLSATGSVRLSVRFEPADYLDYNSVTAAVMLNVNAGSLKTARIFWLYAGTIPYGTALSSSQLDASVNYPGTLTYSPALGTVLGAGNQKLNVTFTPNDPTKVAPASASTSLKVEKTTPTVTVSPAASKIKVAEGLGMTIAVSGSGSTPSGTVIVSSGSFTSWPVALISGSASFTIPKGSLAAGTDTLTASYISDSISSANYNNASGTALVTVTPLIALSVTVTPDATTLPYAENLIVTATVAGGSGQPTPGGTAVLSDGSYTSPAVTLNSGTASFYIQPGTLAQGSGTLTVSYKPDAGSSATYLASSGTSPLTLTAPGSTNITVNINTLANRHQISPYIYGVNSTNQTDITNLSPTLVRMGGNAATNFNWTNSHYNSGADYFFEDSGFGDGNGNPLSTTALTQFTVNSGSHMLNTMPMLNWVAQSSGWSFSVKEFGSQCQVDPYNNDAGNGLQSDCQTPVTTQPVTSAYYPLVDTPQDCPSGTAVTLTPPSGTTFTANGASVLFTTSAGMLSNGTTSGSSVIAITNSSGVASVTLTLPSTAGTVTVTAQDQFALGGTSVTFTETAN